MEDNEQPDQLPNLPVNQKGNQGNKLPKRMNNNRKKN